MEAAKHFLQQYEKRLIFALLAFCAVLGLSIAGQYGMGWDEPISDHGGQVALAFVQNVTDPNALIWTDYMRYYGTAFELPLAFVEETFKFSSHDVFTFRHIATFLLFLVGVFFFYLLCLRRFKSEWWALLGAVFLLVSPRIFADAFYNSKDIPTLVFFIISIFTLVRLLEKPNFRNVLWHALACALLIDIRLPGIFVPVLTFGFFVLTFIFVPEQRRQWRKIVVLLGAYIVSLAGLVVLFWPFLWQHPVAHFLEAYADMSHFSRQAGLGLLYAGQNIAAADVPWHYIPLWILITTPLTYLVLFFLGAGASIGHFFGNARDYFKKQKQDLVVLCWFFGPLSAVIILHSIVYDGWRQLYFIYPALIYISLVGIEEVLIFLRNFEVRMQTLGKRILVCIIGVSLLGTLWFMIRNHPYQNLYFNALIGGQESARKNFEMDYWGLTFREGLEYILAHDNDLVIPVTFAGGSEDNTLILTPEMKKRFSVLGEADIDSAKYVLSNYRWQQYDNMPWDNEFYSVKIDGVKVMTVFKMR